MNINWESIKFDPVEKLYPLKPDPIEELFKKREREKALQHISKKNQSQTLKWFDKEIPNYHAGDFLDYFATKWEGRIKLPYVYVRGKAAEISQFVRICGVLRKLSYTNSDIKDYIDYYFKVASVEELKPDLLLTKINEYNIYRYRKLNGDIEAKKKFKVDLSTKEELAKLAEKEALEYYGRGYSDDKLNKLQYFVGLKWREQNLTKEELKKLDNWQEKNFDGKIIARLNKWKEEFQTHKKDFDLKKAFYYVEAKKEGKPVRLILEKYHATALLEKAKENK
jgi:hypothetical protein